VPVGGLARVDAEGIHLTSGAFSLSSHPPVRSKRIGTDPQQVGKRAAEELMARGAAAILAEFHKAAGDSPAFAGEAQ
jgi:porphobilinogen deaminase